MPYPATPSYNEKFLGLNDGTSTELQDFEAARLENLYLWNRGQELRRRDGTQPFITDLPNPQLDYLSWNRLETTNKLLAVNNSHVMDLLLNSPYFLPGGLNRFTIGEECHGAQITNKVYIGNGIDPNCFVDISGNVNQLMPEQPDVTGLGVNASGSAVGMVAGNTYRISFLSAGGIQGQVSDVLSGTSQTDKVTIVSGIPLASATSNSAGRQIWRTINGGTQYYLVVTISDNTTTGYLDTTADANVDTSVVLDETIVSFPPCKYLVNYQERLAGVFCSVSGDGDRRTLFISDYQIPEICRFIAPLDEVDDPTFGARIPIPDEATGLIVMGNVLIVYSRGTAYRLIGDNPNNWSFDKWIDIGCMSHRTLQVYKSLIFWLGPDGVYIGEGQGGNIQITRISDTIREEIDAISADGFMNTTAFVWNDRYYLCFEDQAYYYDTTYRVWGKLTSWLWGRTTVSRNTGLAKELIYAGQIDTGEVWQLESGSDDDGTPITTVWKSKTKDMGQFGRQKRIHRVIVAWLATSGTATVNLYRGAGELVQTFTQDISVPTRTGGEISTLDKRCNESARDELFSIQIECDTEADYRITQGGWLWTLST